MIRFDFTGLPALHGETVAQRRALDAAFRRAATDAGAIEFEAPPLQPVAALERADYFRAFPQHATLAAPFKPEDLEAIARPGATAALQDSLQHLRAPAHAFAPAACYGLHQRCAGSRFDQARTFTLVSDCCRWETSFEDGERQWCFRMREIVHYSDAAGVRDFLAHWSDRIAGWLEESELEFEHAPATDPFFRAADARSLLQRLEPTKHEFLWQGRLALASVNFHRTFFGETYDLRDAQGSALFSGCVAFGLDRWLCACRSRWGERLADWPRWIRAATEA